MDYNFLDPTLPVGWTVSGKPAWMKDLLDEPLNIKDPAELTDVQKRALVLARVRKSPLYFSQPIMGYVFFHDEALRFLHNPNTVGLELIQSEINSLHALYEDLVIGYSST